MTQEDEKDWRDEIESRLNPDKIRTDVVKETELMNPPGPLA